jgi:hypothetical protein
VTAASVAAAQSALSATLPVSLPTSQLVTREHGINTVFWRFELAPVRWTEAPLAGRVRWSVAAGGVESATLTVAGSGEAWRIRVVLVRLDPAALDFSLDTASTTTGWPAGAIGRAPKSAVFAMNAGQFRSTAPWGMVVINGRRTLPAERGPLAVTIAVDSSGLVHWIPDGAPLPDAVRWAFQSYPAVLRARQVPMASQVPDRGVDVGHRDARLAIGRLADGKLLVAITRFDGLDSTLESVPFGLTAPEMAGRHGSPRRRRCRAARRRDLGTARRRNGTGTPRASRVARCPAGSHRAVKGRRADQSATRSWSLGG